MERSDSKASFTEEEQELVEEENHLEAIERARQPEEDSRLDMSQLSEDKSNADDSQSQSIASNRSESFDDLDKYVRNRERDASSEKPAKRKTRVSKPTPPEKSERPAKKATSVTKHKPQKKNRQKKEMTETQRIIAEQQCKLCFNRLADQKQKRGTVITQVSLRNALQRFNGQCDLEKLVVAVGSIQPMMNIADAQKDPPLGELTFEQFQRVFMAVQSHH